MMPGRSIIRPTLIPERSVVSKWPLSMRIPAQVWQRLSVGGCSPSDSTQGQNTVQLHDKASSPLRLQLSVNCYPRFFCVALPAWPLTGNFLKHPADTESDQHH